MTPLEIRLRQLTATLDETALEALASKGLLRRAQKDLERGTLIAVEDAGSSLRISVGEQHVTLPESGPAKATCSCPTAGVCQHILAAVLYLRREVPATDQAEAAVPAQSSAEDSTQELMRLTAEQLERWAGKAAFRAGVRIEAQCPGQIVTGRGLQVRFPSINAECHVVPGGGLDGMIVSGGTGDGRPIVVAAVITVQRANGVEWASAAGAGGLEASRGAPRSRAEVLEACQSLLDETLSIGLSRLSSANQQRWATLAVSALGVNLPRLALVLRGVSDEAALALARDARADLGRMLARMARAYALCTALQKGGDTPRADLVGWHRTLYAEIGHVNLVGAAAWPWRTASGYEGLTVLFWDPSARRWNSWTDSRPRHQLGDFKPVACYTQPGPWEGADSPQQLARSSLRLMNARRNSGQRLSSSSKSRVLVTGPAKLTEHGVAAIEDWSQLLESLRSQVAIGLNDANPLDSIFALRPTVWGERGYDEVAQAFSWVLVDSHEQPLRIELSFDDLSAPAITYLENVSLDGLAGAVIIGRVQQTPRGLSLHPYAVHRRDGRIVHPFLDNLTPTPMPQGAVAGDDEDEERWGDAQQDDSEVSSSPTISRMLDEVDDGLLAMAESGFSAVQPTRVEGFRPIAPRAERLGLARLASCVRQLIGGPQPSTALRCAYLSRLHRQALACTSSLSSGLVDLRLCPRPLMTRS